jgi:putative membrane-bound dehydrogenase-like protein
MKRMLFLPLLITSVVSAAEFPELTNTNSATNGTGAPPLTAEESLAQMTSVPDGFKGSVFASEPDIQNPVAMTWDSQGRLWVAENYSYDSDRFVDTFRDRIVILEGADGGSRFTSRRVFADNLTNLMGFAIGWGGLWVMSSPEILFIPDRNADGVPDGPAEVVYDGFNAAGGNMHTSANGLEFGIDGWIYGRTGHAHLQMVGPPGTPTSQRTRLHGSIFRFHPVTRAFEALGSGTVNPFGQDWDKYGEHFFDSTIVGPFWYSMPGAKFVSSSAEPNLKAYELLDQIGDFDFRGAAGGRGGGGGGGRGAGAGGLPAWAAGPWNNGHAVTGMMIYQGDNWPAEYRDRMYAINLFGHRVVVQDLGRSGSGFVASRAPEPDIFEFPDPWFRGIDITYGPDGGVFLSDWTDTGDYHNRSGSNRLSGRIFKLTYGDVRPSKGSDLNGMTVEQLVALNTHANEWFPRMARVEFSNRLTDGRGIGNARQLLRDQFTSEADLVNRLRALWTLYVVGGTDEALLLSLLRSPEEPLRVWGIRLLTQHWPIDALHTRDVIPPGATGRGAGGAIFVQQRPAPIIGGSEVNRSPAVIAEFNRMASEDSSSLVRLVLASTLQRMPYNLRPALAAGLVSHAEDANDKNLPLMVWWGIIPIADSDPSTLAALAARTELPTTRKYIARRLAEDFRTNPGPVDRLVADATGRSAEFRSDIIDGLTQGLEGQQALSAPPSWDAFSDRIHAEGSADLMARVRALDVQLGSTRAIAEARATVANGNAAAEARATALRSLMSARVPDLQQLALPLLQVPGANAVAANALAGINDPALAPQLVAAYPRFAPADRPQLIDALSSRVSFARVLLDSVAGGAIPRASISASQARQIRNLGDTALASQLAAVWGEVRDTPEAKQALLATYRAELSPPQGRGGRGGAGGGRGRGGPGGNPLALADRSQGRTVFATSCAVCHALWGEGGSVGPDLTGGSRRRELDALLAKLVDPSSELPSDSRYTFLHLRDGRTLGGIVVNRTATTLTLRTVTESAAIALTDIESTETANYSIMPEGLLESLDATQRRDLIAYLMGDEQAPLPAAP